MSATVATSITALAPTATNTAAHTESHTESHSAGARHPCKQLVRAYLARRCQDKCPPPAPEDIRRELGWEMVVPQLDSAPVTHA